MTIYEHFPRLKHTNNLLLGLTCGGIDLVCHIKENEVVQREGPQYRPVELHNLVSLERRTENHQQNSSVSFLPGSYPPK